MIAPAGGVAELMEAMAAAGAPLEAILVAVRALEAQGRAERERKDKEARRKAEKRAEAKATIDSGESRNPVAEPELDTGFRRGAAKRARSGRGVDCPRTAVEQGARRPRTRRGRAPDGASQKENPPHPLKKNSPPDSKAEALVPRRLAEDFVMPADWKNWARDERGWAPAEIESEAANFTDYWLARGAGAAKRDWRRTWQTWVRNARRPDGPHRDARKASPEEVREAQLRAASLYERIGRSDEAAEIRRRWGGAAAVPVGAAAAGILARRSSNESGKEQG